MRATDSRIEFTDKGFNIHRRRFLWSWNHQKVSWESITSIKAVMWDCYTSHIFGYRLLFSDGTSVCVTDAADEWDHFQDRLHETFPEMDSAVVHLVKEEFPRENELTCWSKK